MTDWMIGIVFMLGLVLQGIGGSTLRFIMPTKGKQQKWTVSAYGGNALLNIAAEFGAASLSWIAILPGGHGAFDFPLYKPPLWQQWVSVILIVLAGLLNGFARRALGDNWFPGIARRKGHTVTTSGPYSYVRHPMYTSYIMYAIGFIGASGGAIVIACSLWMIVAYLTRIKHEERLLTEVRAQQYRNYRSEVGAIIPRFSTLRQKLKHHKPDAS